MTQNAKFVEMQTTTTMATNNNNPARANFFPLKTRVLNIKQIWSVDACLCFVL